MANAPRLSVAASISSELYSDAPPSYDDAIQDRPPHLPPVQDFANLSVRNSPTSPSHTIPRRPVPTRSGHSTSRPRTASQSSKVPTVGQCISHLQLLECFHRLREEIGSADGLFGLRDEFVPPSLEPQEREPILAKLCEKRWEIYVTRATLRFQSYWRSLQADSRMLVEADLKNRDYIAAISRPLPIVHTPDSLPPLDILMVFHAFMLNPRAFYADSVRFGKTSVWAAGMPWDALESALGVQYSSYRPNERSRSSFQQKTKHPWDNLDEPQTMPLRCPRCSVPTQIPWTTTDNKRTWASDMPGEDGRGFADKGFSHDCSTCGLKINHDVLRTQRFKNDLRALFTQGYPMPGTFVSKDGLAAAARSEAPGSGSYQMTFPNRLLKSGLGKILAQACSVKQNPNCKMVDVVNQINAALENPKMLRRARGTKAAPRPASLQERFAIRRMMSTYWDNSSIFSMDLVGAVIRQNQFTGKMNQLDWLHSPALSATMNRLISKYTNFIQLMGSYPMQTVVPTLDVDLAWHTHQLQPPSYLAYTLEITNTFVNHDDKIDENSLSNAFEWTSKTYQETYNKIYSECTCWYCEAMRETHQPPSPPSSPTPGKLSRLLNKSKHSASSSNPSSSPLAQSYAHLLSTTSPLTQGPHISTHNATRSQILDVEAHVALVVQTRRLDRAYELACDKAARAGKPPPPRDDDALRWGHRVPPREGFAPFMADACLAPGLFVADPGCEGKASSCCPEAPVGGEEVLGGCVAIGGAGGRGIAVGACGSCGACGGGFCGGGSGFGGCAGGGGNEASGSGSGSRGLDIVSGLSDLAGLLGGGGL